MDIKITNGYKLDRSNLAKMALNPLGSDEVNLVNVNAQLEPANIDKTKTTRVN